MTCLIDRGLSWARMKLLISILGTFFVYTLGLSMQIFKKIFAEISGKSSKVWVLHKKFFICNTQSLEHFPRNLHEDFFLKISILSPKVSTKNVPKIEVCNFILAPLITLFIKQDIVCSSNWFCKILLPSVNSFLIRRKLFGSRFLSPNTWLFCKVTLATFMKCSINLRLINIYEKYRFENGFLNCTLHIRK